MNKDEIMKQFDEAIKNLKEWVEDEPKEKPEWEEKLDELTAGEWDKFRLGEIFKDFIRQEFKAIGEEVRIEMMRRDAFPWQETVDIVVNEALRKRGVE